MESMMYVSTALFLLAFVLLLSIVFYRPRAGVPPLRKEESGVRQEPPLSYEKKWIRWIPAFEASHPDSQILFRKTALKHGVFLEGRLARTDSGILFVMHGETCFRLLMQAMEKMLRDDRLPGLSCSILLCGEDDCDGLAEQELAVLLRQENRSYALCLSDSGRIRRLGGELYGCAAIQRKGIMDLRISPDGTALPSGPYAVSGLWRQTAPLLPLRLRMQLLIPPLRKKGIRNLIRVMPEAEEMFCSAVRADGSEVHLTAENSVLMEKMLAVIRGLLTQAPVLLRQASSSRTAESAADSRICACLRNSFENVKPLRVLGEDQRAAVLEPHCRNWVSFAPVGDDVSHAGSVAFYRRLLEEENL